jgi:hypothetical protein
MANDIQNTMSIRKEDAKKYVLNKNNEVDFNILIPMSDELDLPSGSIIDLAIEIYDYRETGEDKALLERIKNCKKYYLKYPDNVEDLIKYEDEVQSKVYKDKNHFCYCERYVDLYTLGKQYIENVENYGSPEWYSWTHNNWGVKWNARDTKIKSINDDLYKITFITPWDTPIRWLKKLSTKCVFYLEWIDEPLNNGDHGEIYSNKKFYHEWIGEPLNDSDDHGEIYSNKKEGFIVNALPNTLFDDKGKRINQRKNPTIRFKDMCNKVTEWYNEE